MINIQTLKISIGEFYKEIIKCEKWFINDILKKNNLHKSYLFFHECNEKRHVTQKMIKMLFGDSVSFKKR
jgi:hypothetical protein